MSRVNHAGYLERKVNGGGWRNWWLIKCRSNTINGKLYKIGVIQLYNVSLPKKYIGKRIRIKIETIEDTPKKGLINSTTKKE